MRKTVLIAGTVLLTVLCAFLYLRLTPSKEEGAIIRLNSPLGYRMSVRDLGPHNLLWQMKKQESTYTVKSNVTLRVEDPLTRFTQVSDVSALIEGYKPHTTADAKTKPSNLVIHRSQEVTVNGIAFSGYQSEEARLDGFVVVHVAAFTVRGRSYNCDAVFRFDDKRPDPAKVKIAEAEWKSILSSIR